MRGRFALTALLPLVAIFLTWANLAAAEPRVFVDAAGRKVELPEKFTRVMAAGPPASVLLYALAPDRMAGWVREPSPEEKAFLAQPYRDIPAHGRLTGKENTANQEAVIAAKPDMILDIGTVDPTYASLADRVQEQTGIPYILIDGSFERTPQALREVATLIGAQEKGEELARYAEATLTRLKATVAEVPAQRRPRVYYGRGPEGLETGLAGSINMEVLEAVGATNVAAAAGSDGHSKVSTAQVLSWDPDVILAASPKFQKSVLEDPQWLGVRAVEDGRVYRVPNLPYSWVDAPPGINRLIGAAWLATLLYPKEAKLDLAAETRKFYKLFYHVDITEDQLASLLAGASR